MIDNKVLIEVEDLSQRRMWSMFVLRITFSSRQPGAHL